MTEHDGDQVEHPAIEHPAVEHTGHPVVDRVLDSLEDLAGTPVADHVAVFESAHDQLRGALANAGDPSPQLRG